MRKPKQSRQYTSAHQVIRNKPSELEFSLQPTTHVCGFRMLECTDCRRVFCSDCDVFYKKMPKCCRSAVDAYTSDSEGKRAKKIALKKELAKRVKSPKTKYNIKIEEISSGNIL